MKRINLIILASLAVILLVQGLPSVQAVQPWCDSSLQNRFQITIQNNNQTSKLIRNQTMLMSFDMNPYILMKENVTIYYNDSCLQLDVVNETAFGSSTRLAFPLRDDIPQASQSTNYFIYYNSNTSTQFKTNKSAIYNFSEDFENYAPNSLLFGQGGWKTTNNGGGFGMYVVDNKSFSGNRSLNITNNGTSDFLYYNNIEKFTQLRIRFMINSRTTSDIGSDFRLFMAENNNQSNDLGLRITHNSAIDSDNTRIFWFNDSGNQYFVNRLNKNGFPAGTTDVWNELVVVANRSLQRPNEVSIFLNGVNLNLFNISLNMPFVNFMNNISIASNALGDSSQYSQMYIDDLSVSNVIFPEPSFSLGAVQNLTKFNVSIYDEISNTPYNMSLAGSSNITFFCTTSTNIVPISTNTGLISSPCGDLLRVQLKMNINGTIIFRTLKAGTSNNFIFYMFYPSNVQEILLQAQVIDPSNVYSSGSLIVEKLINQTPYKTMIWDDLGPDGNVYLWLVQGERYRLSITNGQTIKLLGDNYFVTDATQQTFIASTVGYVTNITTTADLVSYFDVNESLMEIDYHFIDYENKTSSVTFNVYNASNNNLIASSTQTYQSVYNFAFLYVDNSSTYRIVVNIVNPVVGSGTFISVIFGFAHRFINLFVSNVWYERIAGFMIIGVTLLFGALYRMLAPLAASLTAAFFYSIGFLTSVGPLVIGACVVLSGLGLLVSRRRGDND